MKMRFVSWPILLVLLSSIMKTPAAIASPPMCDANCVRRCQACKEVCVLGYCHDICTPPEPTCLGICHSGKAIACAYQAVHKNAPFHGNYCGWGNTSHRYKKQPTDVLDAACMKHDKCYDKLYRMACSCDKLLAVEAMAISANPGIDNSIREKAVLVYSFYSATAPCL
jgi:hypothetical protein